jgi:LysM repeat protein
MRITRRLIQSRHIQSRRSALLAVVSCALAAGACSHNPMPGPTWNLTGGKDRAPLPPKSIYAEPGRTEPGRTEPSRQAALPPAPSQQPVVIYRGGRDPVTGRAPSFGGTQPGLQVAPAIPQPAMTEPRSGEQRSHVAPTYPAYSGPPQPHAAQPHAAQTHAAQTHAVQPRAGQPTPPVPNARGRVIEVRPGQTLSIIAAEQRVSIAALMTANNLRDPYLIPGQALIIPRH